MLLEWIVANKEFAKIIYALAVMFICGIIFLRADRLFKISDYQGLRYFRNSFLFYGLGFFTQLILVKIVDPLPSCPGLFGFWVGIFAKFFLLLASFFLLYSLLWKKFERVKNHHSLFNLRMVPIYLLSLIVILFDLIFVARVFELSQLIVFFFMALVMINTLIKGSNSRSYKKYFLVISLGFIASLFNYLTFIIPFAGGSGNRFYIYLLNSAFFFLFFYFSYRATKK